MTAPRRQWVYALEVKGRFQRIHRASGLALQLFLFLVPWIEVRGVPVFRFDLPARRVYALGAIFTAQDTVFLVLMGLAAAFALFLFTALFGRLWCGYACPQTVFLEEWIRPLETWIEGSRGVRMARDKRGWTWARVWRKAAKWTAFAVVAAVVAMGSVSWFVSPWVLWGGRADPAAYAVVGVLAVGMFWDFAWFREQFCNYLCPYARFQGALTDPASLVVAYQAERGEPRRGEGSCIDCKKCVAVCPQGIDIREGFQLECITCGRCIDACDDVLGKRGEQGLIRYTALARGGLVRPRTVAYAALICAVLAVFTGLLATRHDVQANIARAPGTLYIVDADGWTRNTYLLQVTNNAPADAHFDVTVEGLPADGEVDVPSIAVGSSKSATVPVIVRVPPGEAGARTVPIVVRVANGHDHVLLSTTFKTAEG